MISQVIKLVIIINNKYKLSAEIISNSKVIFKSSLQNVLITMKLVAQVVEAQTIAESALEKLSAVRRKGEPCCERHFLEAWRRPWDKLDTNLDEGRELLDVLKPGSGKVGSVIYRRLLANQQWLEQAASSV
jgi:hypothetical protein